jgi:hypothetical protein
MPVTGCSRISVSSDGVKFFLRCLLFIVLRSLQWRVRRRKLEVHGGVLGKHAPANANTLIKIRAAIIIQIVSVSGLFR